MSIVSFNPAGGYDPFLLDPDNPYYPSANLDGAYFDNVAAVESYGDSPAILYSYTNTVSFWYKIANTADKSVDTRPVLTVEDSICYRVNMEIVMEYNAAAITSNLVVATRGANLAQVAGFTVPIPTHDSTWHHIAFYQKSWDVTAQESLYTVYIDGVLSAAVTSVFNFVSDSEFAYQDHWAVGSGVKTEIERFEGCLDELYFTFDNFPLDATSIQTLRNTTTGLPVPLGQFGEIPSGSPAYLYMEGAGPGFTTNSGSRTEPFIATSPLTVCT